MAEKNVFVVKDLLSKAVKVIEGLANPDEGETSTAKPIPSTTNQGAGTSFKTEMERLFPNVYGMKRPSNTNFSTVKWRRGSSAKKKEKTVTRKFVCLADKSQAEVPTVQEKRELFLCGLGEKKIALPVDGTFARLYSVLVDSSARQQTIHVNDSLCDEGMHNEGTINHTQIKGQRYPVPLSEKTTRRNLPKHLQTRPATFAQFFDCANFYQPELSLSLFLEY